jgi:hypothetical protein
MLRPVRKERILTPMIFPCSRPVVMRVGHGDIDIALTTRDVRHWGTVD